MFNSHGTNDMWNNLWKEKWAFLQALLYQMPLAPMGTNRPGYMRAVADREIFDVLVYSMCGSHSYTLPQFHINSILVDK